ncbi:glycosyltransferase family 1 protein [Larkinella rosea]|uniref:Glycosyltransferase family 1 protein n=1 Tax=Larkinella rosea TaxID=2025312 RepID=A0A3P1C7P2_9BACT|nr:glycosyltransferase family 1 protein [Larkinella rosea]RRB09315.1 glycosyltransferase family 1 protein [Larkinella rosea]
MSILPMSTGTRPGALEIPAFASHQRQDPLAPPGDLLCFSHLRWDFVYQRPQHLLSQASPHYRIWFWEEPVGDTHAWLEIRALNSRMCVLVPHLPAGSGQDAACHLQRGLLNEWLRQQGITDFIAWYYTPMALAFTDHLRPRVTVYDCMDELAAFQGAPPQLRQYEKQLIQRATLVFTGGVSLFEAKQPLHPSVHAFPSSIDTQHFAQARQALADPADQKTLSFPRIGYSGVIDERLDIALLRKLSQNRPDWQFVFLGPVVKIDPATLPQGPNLHYLGLKPYDQLPAYFSNWQVALLPFARNESTRFISPTKTPEYLAAGLPVVSSPIRDVVRTYGSCGPLRIAETPEAFETAIEALLQTRSQTAWNRVDEQLGQQSWQQTWNAMHRLIVANLPPAPGTPLRTQALSC